MSEPKYANDIAKAQIASFLEETIDNAGLDLDVDVAEAGAERHSDFENPELVINFSGPDVGMLLEHKAELLLALEHLTMEVLRMPAEDHSLICFDANDYRRIRIEELRMSASTAAERVRKTHAPFLFAPMNSRERRILHLALRAETDLRSESVGAGGFRQVCLLPADAPLPPAPAPPAHRPHSRGFAAMTSPNWRPDPEESGDRGRGRFGDRRGGGGGRGGDRDRGPRRGGPRR
ncbi:MAG: hypothetical protein K2Q23_15260 [Bryobacteraceae bacterium]|nr:hypothetical protein [Bryobacteraceae bacterium]